MRKAATAMAGEPDTAGPPRRIRLARTRGWRMPGGAVKVDRTTRWGNPFTVAECGSAEAAVERHRQWLAGTVAAPDARPPPTRDGIRAGLAGRDLACWCPLDGPCHADTLLAIANG